MNFRHIGLRHNKARTRPILRAGELPGLRTGGARGGPPVAPVRTRVGGAAALAEWPPGRLALGRAGK